MIKSEIRSCTLLSAKLLLSPESSLNMQKLFPMYILTIFLLKQNSRFSVQVKVFIFSLCLVLATQVLHTFNVPVDVSAGPKDRLPFELAASEDVTFSFAIPATPTIGVGSVTFLLEVFNAGGNTVAYSKSITVTVGGSTQDSGWKSAPVGSYEMTLTPTSTFSALAVVQFDVETSSGVIVLQNMLDYLGIQKYRVVYASSANTVIVCQSPDSVFGSFLLLPISQTNYQFGSVIVGSVSGTTTTFSNLATGFYLLAMDGLGVGTRTYQTNIYSCPSFLQGHTDFQRLFEGCVDRTTYFNTANPYPDTFPVFNLPGIQQRQVIHIQLDFIHQSTSAANNKFRLSMLDATGAQVPQALPFNQLLNVPAANTPYKTFWTAPFAGEFNLLVLSEEGVALEHLQIYYITIYKSNGDLLVTAVDVLREATSSDFIVKYMHFDPTPEAIVLSTDVGFRGAVNSLNAVSFFKVNVPPDYLVAANYNRFSSDGTNHVYGLTDNPGQSSDYLAKFKYQSGTLLTIGIRSDPYQCPYDTTSAYVDLRKVFQHCIGSTPNAPAAPVAMSPTVYGDTIQVASKSDRAGRYPLGNVASGDKLKFTLTFRLPTNALPTKFNVKILDPSLNIVATIVEDEVILEEPEFVKTIEWTSTVTSTNNHFVEVTQMGTDVEAFRIYELLVENLQTDPSTILVQSTDILRNEMNPSTTDKLFNLIHLKDPSSITMKNTIPSSVINLYAMGEDSEFIKFVDGIPITTGRVATADSLGYTYSNLAAGWYGAEFIYDGISGPLGSIFFQSNTYVRPYNAAYNDFRGAFDPCMGQETMVFPVKPSSGGSSSPINIHQLYIMQAYRCTSNQFFNGSCRNMDLSKNCNTFNALSGDCTTCPSTKYTLTSGACITPKQCSLSETQVGTVCVSILCRTSDAKGLCTSCKSVLNEVKADGSCGPKNCADPEILNKITGNCDKPPKDDCDPGYFPIDQDCYLLPPNCKALSPFLTCEVCDDGHTPEGGSCVKSNGVEGATSGGGQGELLFGNGGSGGIGGSGGFEIEANGAESITFIKSRFFRDCADIDEEKEVCNFCKPGAIFVKGNFCAFA